MAPRRTLSFLLSLLPACGAAAADPAATAPPNAPAANRPDSPATAAPSPIPTPSPTATAATEAAAADLIEIRSLNPDFLFEYELATGTVSATNGVQVVFRDATLTARRVQLDQGLGDALAEGGVRLERGGQTWIGERLRYNFRSGAMNAEEFKLGVRPVFVGGERALTLEPTATNRIYQLEDAYLTTDDLAQPGYRIRAKSLTLRPDRRLVAKDATLVVGDTPVFWFPYYTRRIDDHPTRWVITPGYRSLYGLYARAAYQFDLAPDAQAAINVDPYSKRGVGMGPDLTYDLGKAGHGNLRGYWIADQRPDPDPVTGEPRETQRYRVSFDHQVTLRPGLTGTAVVRQQSDNAIVGDFFEDEFRRNPLPQSFFEAQQAWPDFTLNALARVQVNDFWETQERLPDVRFSAHRQQLGGTPLYYESESSAGWYQHRFPNGSVTNDYSAFRGDSFHQLLLPNTFFGWLNVTPRAGGRVTYYGDTQGDGWSQLEATTRGVFNTGAEVSFKAYRVWRDRENKFWDVQGLRHILEPSVNYAYTPEPNARPLELPQFDSELPTLRPLPVTYPDYNSIDSIDSQNVLRLGVRNKLQTKRDGRVEDLLDWALLTDWRLDPTASQHSFGDVYSEADFKPRRWLTFNNEIRFDPNDALMRESQTSAILKPGTDWSFAVTHRYTRDDPALGVGGNLVGTRLYLRFSENWGFRTSHYYEIKEGILQEQYYTVYRDLRSLTAALTLRFRENVGSDDDLSVALSISLKAFPRFRRGQDAERPVLLIGG
jgi:LPS-assembly protein